MTSGSDRRHAQDRRRFARGGRRPTDRQGHAPLVLVADEDVDSGARCEAILAKLRFAVAPAHSVDEAIRVMYAIKPNLVVSHLKDDSRLRNEINGNSLIAGIPVITVTEDTKEPEALVEEIRRVLRQRLTIEDRRA